MRYLDICSGLSAPTQAWAPLGWQCAGYAEIDPFPREVLAQRYGAVPVDGNYRWKGERDFTPLFHDFTRIEAHHVGPVDILVGGTPCQSFSTAGQRAGLDDPRGNLTLEYLRLAARLRPRWLVWENVAGFMSHDGGRTMGTLIGLLEECGYSAAWRVLDAQFVRVESHPRAVPQRRRRIFFVGHLGDTARPQAVLFEPESMCGHSPPRRKIRKEDAGLSISGTKKECGNRRNISLEPKHKPVAFDCKGTQVQTDVSGVAPTMRTSGNNAVAFSQQPNGEITISGGQGEITVALTTGYGKTSNNMPAVALDSHRRGEWAARRLTPRECERLQGFEDNFTAIPWRGKPEDQCPDGPRYKALGNSMAVNVMRWIGERIAMVDAVPADQALESLREFGAPVEEI